MIALRNTIAGAGKFRIGPIDLEIPTGQYGILMGKTGCGKTTLLEAVCGLRRVYEGTVTLGDRELRRSASRALGLP